MIAMADYLLSEFFNKDVAKLVATARDFAETVAQYLEHVRIASLVDERRHYDVENARLDKAAGMVHDARLAHRMSQQ